MAWPVNASSIWALSAPVVPHWARNLGRARPAIDPHPEHRQRDGDERHDREQRRDHEHHHRHADEQQDRREHLAHRLLEALGQVVEVVGDPAEQVTALVLVDVAQRERVDLGLGGGSRSRNIRRWTTPAISQAVSDRRAPSTRRRAPGRLEEDPVELAHVDALPGSEHALDDRVGGVAEHAAAADVQDGADDRRQQHEEEDRACSGSRSPKSRRTDAPNRAERSVGMPAVFPQRPAARVSGAARLTFGALVLGLSSVTVTTVASGLRTRVVRSCRALLADLGLHDLGVGGTGRQQSPSWVPRPTSSPSSSTRISSAVAIVDTRWATMRTAASRVWGSRAARSRASVARSSAENESSNT